MTQRRNPIIIQGGMGAAVSSWLLARTVSKTGQLGVVSGTGLDAVFIRRLQLGDANGELRWALGQYPNQKVAQRIVNQYFVPEGKKPNEPFLGTPVPQMGVTPEAIELLIVANFVEVCLAKREHDGLVGINYLEKIQLPTLPSIFGAMLAGVDFILMGAGIPRIIPGVLDQLSQGERVKLPLSVEEAGIDDEFSVEFDPATMLDGPIPPLKRPRFLAIVSSTTLATMLTRKSTGRVDGFVVEGPTAGGHNAPPRGPKIRNTRGEPIYGERDVPDLAVFRSLGLPFWLAGSYGSSEQVLEALAEGAAGVQVGTAFAFCEESALDPDVKRRTIELCRRGQCDVFTDSDASPAGFPFKVLRLDGSLSDAEVYEARRRVCDLGYLRHAYKKPDGTLGWRCPAESVDVYAKKGGDVGDTRGRKCLCNALLANIGVAQVRKDGYRELPLITCGDDVRRVTEFLPTPDAESYSAHDVLAKLLSRVPPERLAAADNA